MTHGENRFVACLSFFDGLSLSQPSGLQPVPSCTDWLSLILRLIGDLGVDGSCDEAWRRVGGACRWSSGRGLVLCRKKVAAQAMRMTMTIVAFRTYPTYEARGKFDW